MPSFRVPFLAFLLIAALAAGPARAEPVTFEAEDGLQIKGDVYRPAAPSSTTIVLFHQAGSSRGEYRDI
ncbi:MAG: hypothetical protein MI824_15195, partial [Hyphomicrobiales bacterium]|nr:hypothetical protein [Hyphomicrobiales bacterium]